MPQFLYFIPDPAFLTAEKLRVLGLAATLPLKGLQQNQGVTGPTGARGLLATLGPAETCVYDPHRQAWQACAANGSFWLGFETATQPGPQDLLRPDALGGLPVELADGRQWTVPIARAFEHPPSIPRALSLNAAGELEQRPIARYAAIVADATRVWQDFRRQAGDDTAGEASGGPLPLEEGWRIACAALAMNYRVTPWEIGAMGLLTTANYTRVLEALIDVHTLMEVVRAQQIAAQKKTELPGGIPAGSATGSGAPGSSPSTASAPPSPTSPGSPSMESSE